MSLDTLTRVARALHREDMAWNEVEWSALAEPQTSAFYRSARAAIEALRPPNDDLVRALMIAQEHRLHDKISISDSWSFLEAVIDQALQSGAGE